MFHIIEVDKKYITDHFKYIICEVCLKVNNLEKEPIYIIFKTGLNINNIWSNHKSHKTESYYICSDNCANIVILKDGL